MSDIQASIDEYGLIHRNVKPLKANTIVIDNIDLMEKRSYQQNSFTSASGVTSAVVKTKMAQLEEEKGIKYPKKGNNVKDLNYEQATEIAEALNIQSIREKRAELEANGRKTKPAIINVHDGKGGIGKTALATALAVEGGLDVVNRPRVLLIDGDPQGSLRHLFAPNLKTTAGARTLIDSVKSKSRAELLSSDFQAKFRKYMYGTNMVLDTFMENLKLMPSSEMEKYLNITLSLAQNEKGNEAYSLYSDVILRPLYDDFDLIIIDANPSVDTTLYSFFYAADHHIIPVTGLQQDVNAFVEYLEVCQVILENLQPEDAKGMKSVRTAVTKYSKTNADAKERAETINGTHGSLGTMMIESKKLYEDASANNVPVQLFKSTSRQANTVRDNLKSIYNSATLIPFQDYNLIDEAAE
ncbi:ParA family protein [Vibrio sp. THAF190c]|uniref:ParA family protein n=1 Tax=Vibrio sp. THAF190c TaxID=2587865 RepID=UPI0012696C9D|nr:ParA family protein [Vibrio sp. THAF190c]QFT13382.1 Plasmid partition protein A [Vibrio sp. THAF190c]